MKQRPIAIGIATIALALASLSRDAHADEPASYVGGQVCAGCHAIEAERWKGSHHTLAMQKATEAAVTRIARSIPSLPSSNAPLGSPAIGAPEAKLDRFAALFEPATEPGDICLLAELLSLLGGERFPPLDLSPQRKKERTLAALVRRLERLARQQPVLMIFEDLHWIDPTSREFLDLVLAGIDHLPVLLVATFRPAQPGEKGGFVVGWSVMLML